MAGLVPAIHVFLLTIPQDVDPRDKPGGDDLRVTRCRSFNGGRRSYFIACGLIGLPVPPVMISGGPQKKNS
jgi:hypothetical protein